MVVIAIDSDHHLDTQVLDILPILQHGFFESLIMLLIDLLFRGTSIPSIVTVQIPSTPSYGWSTKKGIPAIDLTSSLQ